MISYSLSNWVDSKRTGQIRLMLTQSNEGRIMSVPLKAFEDLAVHRIFRFICLVVKLDDKSSISFWRVSI